jgi:hypothetical protein
MSPAQVKRFTGLCLLCLGKDFEEIQAIYDIHLGHTRVDINFTDRAPISWVMADSSEARIQEELDKGILLS